MTQYETMKNVTYIFPGDVIFKKPVTFRSTTTSSSSGGGSSVGNLEVTGTLDVTGATTLDSTLNVTGASTFTGAVALKGTATVEADDKFYFRDTGLYIYSNADGKLTVASDGVGADDITLSGSVTTDSSVAVGGNLTVGSGTAGVDYQITFNGEDNDGVLAWLEDEDYFLFYDDAMFNAGEKQYFRDTSTYVGSNNAGYLDLEAATGIRLSSAVTADSLIVSGITQVASLAGAVAIKTANYVVATTDFSLIANKSTSMSITLPAANATGRLLKIRNIGAGNCVVTANGAELIEDANTFTLYNGESIDIIDATSGVWYIM